MTVMPSDIPFIVWRLESFDVDGLSRHDLFWPKTVHNRWNAAEWNVPDYIVDRGPRMLELF